MNSSGHLVVLEYSDGTKRVHSDVPLAPTGLRREVRDTVEDVIDVDAFESGDIIGEVFFGDLLDDASFEIDIEDWAKESSREGL